MAITLSQLCRNAEKNYNMKLVAGRGGMDNTVRWVHMVEDSEVPDFLHGNELVFTTGIGHIGNAWLEPFVKGLKEHNAVGLVVNLGPHIDAVPSRVIVYCEENDFPLFTLPWQVHIIDITYSFCRRIIDNEEAETTLAGAFRNLIFSPDKKDGYAAALERMGFSENASYTVVAVSVGGDKAAASTLLRDNRFGLWRLLKRSRSPVAMFFQDDKLISVRQNADHDEMEQLIKALSGLECDMKLSIGVSEQGEGYLGVPVCYKEAVSALAAAKITGCQAMPYRNIGVYKLLFGVENRGILRSYVSGVLGDIIKYDSMNSTDYEHTLRVYLECSGSVQLTAEKLDVHRNTVNYKMKVIREILNIEMNDEEKMNILLAFRAQEILGASSDRENVHSAWQNPTTYKTKGNEHYERK